MILNTVSPVVDHGHNVGEVEALYHHLHEDVVTASAGHKLLQRELTCHAEENSIFAQKPSATVSKNKKYRGF